MRQSNNRKDGALSFRNNNVSVYVSGSETHSLTPLEVAGVKLVVEKIVSTFFHVSSRHDERFYKCSISFDEVCAIAEEIDYPRVVRAMASDFLIIHETIDLVN